MENRCPACPRTYSNDTPRTSTSLCTPLSSRPAIFINNSCKSTKFAFNTVLSRNRKHRLKLFPFVRTLSAPSIICTTADSTGISPEQYFGDLRRISTQLFPGRFPNAQHPENIQGRGLCSMSRFPPAASSNRMGAFYLRLCVAGRAWWTIRFSSRGRGAGGGEPPPPGAPPMTTCNPEVTKCIVIIMRPHKASCDGYSAEYLCPEVARISVRPAGADMLPHRSFGFVSTRATDYRHADPCHGSPTIPSNLQSIAVVEEGKPIIFSSCYRPIPVAPAAPFNP